MAEELNNIKIIELENIGFSERQQEYLADLFITTVKHMIPTLSRESWFKLEDFVGSEIHGLENFRVLIIRKTIHYQDQWHGIIQDDKKRLKVVAVSANR